MADLRFRMAVDGMTCDACNDHVRHVLEGSGAREVEANWRRREATFAAPQDVDAEVLLRAVREAGYRPRAVERLETSPPSPNSSRGDADYDLVILGAGSAAFAAAIRGRDEGARVAMLEAGTIGGTCVNVGCVPSKALLRAAEIHYQAGHHGLAGISTSAQTPDLGALVAQKDELVAALRGEKYEDLVEEYDWDFVTGEARFIDGETVRANGRVIRSGAFLVATGASPSVPPIPGLDETGYLTSTTALDLTDLPPRIVVIGANAIGLELGQYFLHLGSHVTFFDVLDRIAPFEEPEVSQALTAILRDQGAEVYAPAQITGVVGQGAERVVRATVNGEAIEVRADHILVATGRRPNSDAIDAPAAGIELDRRGAIVVDEHLRTSNPKVFAAGDVTPAPQFVYVSAYEGALAADNALNGAARSVDLTGLPRVTFTSPQVASAGLTEQQALDAGHAVKTSVLPLSAVPRALVNRETRGLIKLVADQQTDELLGASVLAESAGEVIQAAVLAIKYRITTADIAGTFHPYLTMAEGLKLAAQTFTRDVAKLSCCAA